MCIQEVETTPAYPDICFAVDDFDSTFDSVVRFSIMSRYFQCGQMQVFELGCSTFLFFFFMIF